MPLSTSDCPIEDEASRDATAQAPCRVKKRRAIVMVSIGMRQWRDLSAESFAHYARMIGANFHLETRSPSRRDLPLPDMPDAPGRANKTAYASKAYFVFKYLSMGYDQVLVVDDTCIAAQSAPDIFRLVPPEHCGFKRTDRKSAAISFETIRAFQARRREEPIEFSAKEYMNSGFLVYDSSMRDAFSPEKIVDSSDLLFCKFPNQSLTYYLLKKANIKLFLIPEGFNVIPGGDLSSGGRKALRDVQPYLGDIYVYHVTSHFAHRSKIIRQIYDHVAQEWTHNQLHSDGSFGPEIFALRVKVATLTAQLASAEAHEEKARQRLLKMERSLSWRITRPLRSFAKALAILRR